MNLESLKTFTTRYKGEDGKERAVMLWEHYEWLISHIHMCELNMQALENQTARLWEKYENK